MDDFIWEGIWAVFLSDALKNTLIVGVILGWIAWGVVAAKWRAAIYDKIKRESNLERLLDTPQKRETLKMEGNTTYCYPQDEGPLTRICPLCGALYPEIAYSCIYDNEVLLRKPITEPLPVLKRVETLIPQVEAQVQAHDATERADEKELQMIWTALEEQAYQYNKNRPYTFTREEVLSLCKLYDKVREQPHQEKRAS